MVVLIQLILLYQHFPLTPTKVLFSWEIGIGMVGYKNHKNALVIPLISLLTLSFQKRYSKHQLNLNQ